MNRLEVRPQPQKGASFDLTFISFATHKGCLRLTIYSPSSKTMASETQSHIIKRDKRSVISRHFHMKEHESRALIRFPMSFIFDVLFYTSSDDL